MSFELRHRPTLPFVCLFQERPFLRRPERRGLTIQRSDGAISTHIFQNSLPTHRATPFAVDPATVHGQIFEIVSGPSRTDAWFANC
jgi:hypothetical protein